MRFTEVVEIEPSVEAVVVLEPVVKAVEAAIQETVAQDFQVACHTCAVPRTHFSIVAMDNIDAELAAEGDTRQLHVLKTATAVFILEELLKYFPSFTPVSPKIFRLIHVYKAPIAAVDDASFPSVTFETAEKMHNDLYMYFDYMSNFAVSEEAQQHHRYIIDLWSRAHRGSMC